MLRLRHTKFVKTGLNVRMIKIGQPISFSEIGRKDNQEDYLFPLDADNRTRVFVLCDGMGGHDNGELASETVANILGGSLTDIIEKVGEIDAPAFQRSLALAYDALDTLENNSVKKPGTTMTCLCLNKHNCLLAHIGDSRIYHIRPSDYNPAQGDYGIKFQTSDHSLVNELLRTGQITPQQAENYPQKNVITRAMQPNLETRFNADLKVVKFVKGGDYFFMCTDGVLERLSADELGSIIADRNLDDWGKLSTIRNICSHDTRDNYSCWLIPVLDGGKEKTNFTTGYIKDLKSDSRGGVQRNLSLINPTGKRKQSDLGKQIFLWIASVLILIFAIFVIYSVFAKLSHGYPKENVNAKEQILKQKKSNNKSNLPKKKKKKTVIFGFEL